MLLLVNNPTVATKFINQVHLANLCPIKVSYHQHLNNCKGTIYDRYLTNVPEEEIKQNLASQGVIEVFKFKRNVENKTIPTGLVLLTFDLFKLPPKIKVAWYEKEVRAYYPNPMRCKSCQKLGHTTKRCNSSPICGTCNLPPHNPENCTRIMCANCLQQHPASAKICPMYNMMKEILKIKTRDKIPIHAARKKYKEENPILTTDKTFSEILKTNTKSNTTSIQQSNTTITIPKKDTNSSTENYKQIKEKSITLKEKSPNQTSSIASNIKNFSNNSETELNINNISKNLVNTIPEKNSNSNKCQNSTNVTITPNLQSVKLSNESSLQNNITTQVTKCNQIKISNNDSKIDIL
jgi:hypothetical protein